MKMKTTMMKKMKTKMYMKVFDLDDAQIDQLKESMWYADDECAEDLQETYEWWTLSPRSVVEEHFDGISFTEDDFWN